MSNNFDSKSRRSHDSFAVTCFDFFDFFPDEKSSFSNSSAANFRPPFLTTPRARSRFVRSCGRLWHDSKVPALSVSSCCDTSDSSLFKVFDPWCEVFETSCCEIFDLSRDILDSSVDVVRDNIDRRSALVFDVREPFLSLTTSISQRCELFASHSPF